MQEWHIGRGTIAPWDEKANVNVTLGANIPTSLPFSIPPDVLDSSSNYGDDFDEDDTLSGIAQKYRTSVSNIKKWNGLKNTIIYPRQILVINK